jgi:hypothetical protein
LIGNKLDYNALHKWWYLPFLIYILPNFLMSLFVIGFNLLLVDGYPVLLTADTFTIILASVLIIGAFYYVKFISQYFNKKAFIYKDKSPSKYIGRVIFSLQFLDLLTLLLFDFGRVGGVSSSTNFLVVLVSYLPSDILFLLYYGHCRKKGAPYFNLALYLIINVLKGWTGIWLILFFIEIYFQLKNTPFKKIANKVLISFVIIFAFYPTINKYKFLIRGSEGYQEHTLLESASELSIRLQHTTNVILIAQEASDLKTALANGGIIPYYLDNRIGNYLVSNSSMNIQKYLTVNYLIDKKQFSSSTDIDELGWYASVGIVGWLFVLNPIELIFYLVFITLLIATPFILNHYFLKAEGLIPIIQTLTFSYVFHGWFIVHIAFISGILVYILLYNIFNRIAYHDKIVT